MFRNFVKNRKGLSLTEAVIVCLITAVLTLSAVEMLSHAFAGEVGINKNIRARQYKNAISERISSKIKEGSKPYYSTLSLSIPINESLYSVQPEAEALAVLIPKFNADGTVVQPSTGVTTFKGVAFSIVPGSVVDSDKTDYVLLETNAEFDLSTNLSDPITISESLPTDWGSGESYVLAENLKPANFTNLGSDAFDVEGNQVNFAFIPMEGNVYFPSSSGSQNINDGKYITRCQFRNFRI